MSPNCRWASCGASVVLRHAASTVLALLATLLVGCGQAKNGAGGSTVAKPNDIVPDTRQHFLEMFGRTYFPGRTGQLVIVPREGDFITRPDPDLAFMHGSPWPYDAFIPLIFVGPAVKPGEYSVPAAQQDVAPTLAAALGTRMPATATGRVLPILQPNFERPRVVMLLVLDGMRRDYFDRYAALMPTLTALRHRGAWFNESRMNFFPTNTSAGHSTLATGTDPRVHGITGNAIYDRVRRRRHNVFEKGTPQDLVALTLADIWQLETGGRAVIVAQGSVDRAATPLGGHGGCQVNGTPVILASYDPQTGQWNANSDCFRLPAYLKEQNARALWATSGEWLGHQVDSTTAVRYSALFPRFEADAMIAIIEHEPVGQDDVADLILMNSKGPDFVGHKYGPDSNELRATLSEVDRQIARILSVLERKVGQNYLLAVTADHGMPSEPASPEGRYFAPSIVGLLHEKFDPDGKQLITLYEPENSQLFVDLDRLSQLGVTLRDLASFLEAQPFVFAVFVEDDIRSAAHMAK
jgi:Type I phosphodiesterase / nucleotide pyrophosphatase